MKTGKVKWFNTQKGYGFIITEEGKDLFVHFKDVEGGVNAIKDNDSETYEVEDGRKGLQAVKVKKVYYSKYFQCHNKPLPRAGVFFYGKIYTLAQPI